MLLPMLVGAAQLTIDEGVVVKFGIGAGLVVRDTLRIGPGVVFALQGLVKVEKQLPPGVAGQCVRVVSVVDQRGEDTCPADAFAC